MSQLKCINCDNYQKCKKCFNKSNNDKYEPIEFTWQFIIIIVIFGLLTLFIFCFCFYKIINNDDIEDAVGILFGYILFWIIPFYMYLSNTFIRFMNKYKIYPIISIIVVISIIIIGINSSKKQIKVINSLDSNVNKTWLAELLFFVEFILDQKKNSIYLLWFLLIQKISIFFINIILSLGGDLKKNKKFNDVFKLMSQADKHVNTLFITGLFLSGIINVELKEDDSKHIKSVIDQYKKNIEENNKFYIIH